MSAPRRIQRKRAKGWRMPEGAVYVGRSGLHLGWGNPFRVGDEVSLATYQVAGPGTEGWGCAMPITPQLAVDLFRAWVLCRPSQITEYRNELAGRDLACWCPLEDERGNRFPCHADVLLELANGDES